MKFLRRLVLFTFALHLAPGWLALHLAGASVGVCALGALGYAAASAFVFRGRIRLMFDDRPIGSVRALFERAYYALWGASLAVSVLSVVAVPIALIAGAPASTMIFAGVLGLALTAGVYAVFVRARLVRVSRQRIEIPGLPRAFDGFRIAHLSDVHIGSLYRAGAFERIVELTNREDVDLVALTGDYVTTGNRFHVEAARALGRLRGKEGTVAVLGNHDNFGDRQPLLRELEEQGVVVLRNERFDRVVRDGETLRMVGIDDTFTRRANVAGALGHVGGERDGERDGKSETPHVALVHDPRVFPSLAARGIPLTLAGHTHWGQVGIPFLARKLNFGQLVFKRFNTGTMEGSARLVVHPGVGTTGPPMRLGVPPTISVLELRSV